MSKKRPFRIVRTTQPDGPCDLDPSNDFSRFVQLAFYPVPGNCWYQPRTFGIQTKPFTEGQTYPSAATTVTRQTAFGLGMNNNAGGAIWSSRTYPPALQPNSNFAMVVMLQPFAVPWQTLAAPRLFDVSTGSSVRFELNSSGPSAVNMNASCFGGPGGGAGTVTANATQPLVFGVNQTTSGANNMRYFLRADWDARAPRFIAASTTTLDANGSGTDCRCDLFGGSSNTQTAFCAGIFWIAHPSGRVIMDDEVIRFMDNPWQVFHPEVRRIRTAITFRSAWARGANSVIQSGVRGA